MTDCDEDRPATVAGDELFSIGDFVRVERRDSGGGVADGKSAYKGVVAHVGPVDFDDGDDWIGVRVTGDSVRLLEKEGAPFRRFETHHHHAETTTTTTAAAASGFYVRAHRVRKRRPTKLEELRLRRENAEVASVGSSSKSTKGGEGGGGTALTGVGSGSGRNVGGGESYYNGGSSGERRIRKLTETNSSLKNDNKKLVERNSVLESELASMRTRVELLEAQMLHTEGTVRELSAANKNLQAEKADLENQIKMNNDVNVGHQKTVEVGMNDLQTKLEEAMSKLEKQVELQAAEFYREKEAVQNNRPEWLL